jgi:hypothetical protein
LCCGKEALTACEHGIPALIVCPKCHPEKYALTEKQIAHAKELDEKDWQESIDKRERLEREQASE